MPRAFAGTAYPGLDLIIDQGVEPMATNPMHAVVNPAAALQKPYPYIFVNEDGSVRELLCEERKYLETRFSPFDGGRPYIKKNYKSTNGWKSIEGFCLRSRIPDGLLITGAPNNDPSRPMSKAVQIEFLRKKMTGFELTEQPDGTILAKRVTRK
jgi:hypothetical protein